jgi:1-phosphatidylinositol phosphodiesterase
VRFATLFAALAACGGAPPEEPDWLATVDDAQLLSAISIPGTHDSGAMYEPYPGIAQAQHLTIAEQLAAGIRYFDLRCRDVDDQFDIYHGAIDQNQTLDDVLATMYAFLAAHPHEAVIASVKEEAVASGATIPFDQLFMRYVAAAPDRWALGTHVPALGDVRGKLVLLRRFDTTAAALGIDASPWADNASFSIANGDAMLRIEDNYMVSDNDAKWTEITANLAAIADPATLSLTYTSGYQTVTGIPDITLVSDDIDARIDTWLAANPAAPTGVLVMDFATEARASAIIATN